MSRLKPVVYSTLFLLIAGLPKTTVAQDVFPDGSKIPDWFFDTKIHQLDELGKKYTVTDHGVVRDSTRVQTEKLQAVIDKAYNEGGGVIVIPKGVFLSGALFFKQGTNLYLEKGAVLKGSDDISDFPVLMTRIEGQSVKYFPALVNVDGIDGFTLTGQGTVNGNGLRYWKAFWLRREWNPDCTNKDEMRPRLVYVSNSKNVQLSEVHLKDSPFWTTHFYKCENVKLLNLRITSPKAPVKAPSTDAVDIDVCTGFLIKNCYMSVNDDAVALKGGKGPFAHKDKNNGANRNILIEDNTYGFCHSTLTCGSESLHNYNILFRRSTVNDASRVLWLKMRPDTYQTYEYITVEDIKGNAGNMIYIRPWTQFFDLKGEKGIRESAAHHISMKNLELNCDKVFNIQPSDQYELEHFTFENLEVITRDAAKENTRSIQDLAMENVEIKAP
ncbi:glycosyl hydrolase family 28 protein [Sinomicrobium kalidii]|uniref:rhamnogalacturonidase n=1 Tax=Sinomicrobium kalidii TaxID=2900738 RepID=UPI001E458538|nr:glycosyl hydrolase family 28 protein [Sinomicrobium kalidii]UGU18031.1 glycosyl hydrolase family 28 protein [Sinomicrobium kalidii]